MSSRTLRGSTFHAARTLERAKPGGGAAALVARASLPGSLTFPSQSKGRASPPSGDGGRHRLPSEPLGEASAALAGAPAPWAG